jgi:hypothetical protein
MNALDLQTPLGVTLALLPEIVLTAASLVALLLNAWRHTTAADSRLAGWTCFTGVLASGAALGWLWTSGATAAGAPHMVALDSFRFASLALILVATGFTGEMNMNALHQITFGG